jgi:Tfp pilus assembly protein PilE
MIFSNRRASMATRAEEAKAEMQRAAHAGKPKKRATHGAKAKKTPDKAHNLAPKRNRKSSYQLDPVAVGKRPPRKSSRRSDNRQKPDGPLRITEMNKNSRPQARASRASGNPN